MKGIRQSKKKSANTPTGRRALFVISLLFASSAVVRVVTTAGPAIAKEVTALTQAEAEAIAPTQCDTPPDIAAIMTALSTRETLLDDKAKRLATFEQSLALAEDQIRINLQSLQQAEARLSETIASSVDAAESDLSKLTAVYENMKPKDAVGLFEAMTPDFAAGFIGRMRPDAAAAVMTGLKPETAYTISVILAGRNANAPKR